jgi:hypothetical protein
MKMKFTVGSRRSFALVLGVSLLLCNAAVSTTLANMSVAKMTKSSRLIVRARCVENKSIWDAGEIWTFTALEPTEIWKGSVQSRVNVRLLGGRVGNLTSYVSGVPRFHIGEDVVLFLVATQRGDFSVVSWMQGTFRVHRDPRTGADTATQDSASFDTFDPVTRTFAVSGARNIPLDELRAQVTAALIQKPRAQK